MPTENFYLSKYGLNLSTIEKSYSPYLKNPIPSDLKISIVIPCYAEENLFRTLESLQTKSVFDFSAEVIVMINASEIDSQENKNLNCVNFEKGLEWTKTNSTEKLKFHFILNNELPKKHAGVGLARKLGMDEAVYRFFKINFDGVIICADADALYEYDFIQKLHNHFFIHHPETTGCSIYFEHPVSGNEFDQNVYEGIIRYELYLRYYKNSLEYCGFPFAFHTIGSSMATRSSAYQKCGGMNKRKAGEDFYFLQKLIELGNFTELNSTKVIPSPRPSHRVPFGTGRSVSEWLSQDNISWPVYSISIFDSLKIFNDQIKKLYLNDFDNLLNLHPLLISFLKQNEVEAKILEIRKNSTSLESFIKRFYSWFDAFLVLKASHFLRDNGMGTQEVKVASDELLNRLKIKSGSSVIELLEIYRKIDRGE
jgi:glycosyltransferase involved in cell wall biosynthesis